MGLGAGLAGLWGPAKFSKFLSCLALPRATSRSCELFLVGRIGLSSPFAAKRISGTELTPHLQLERFVVCFRNTVCEFVSLFSRLLRLHCLYSRSIHLIQCLPNPSLFSALKSCQQFLFRWYGHKLSSWEFCSFIFLFWKQCLLYSRLFLNFKMSRRKSLNL